MSKYLLAKSFFDCHEYDRCAAVFLPDSLLSSVLNSRFDAGPAASKDKPRASTSSRQSGAVPLPQVSQKSLFLALYAKFLAGEKRKNEESEMVMGPQDLGTVVNKELLVVGRFLSAWFEERVTEDDEDAAGSQGWLEYLYVWAIPWSDPSMLTRFHSYGMVLAREKSDEKAMEFLIRSVHKYTMNWGCWLEMTSLISRAEDVSIWTPRSMARHILTSAVDANIATLPRTHRLLHVPSARLPRAIPAVAELIPLLGATPINLPHIILPPHLQCTIVLPFQGPDGCRAAFQSTIISSPA